MPAKVCQGDLVGEMGADIVLRLLGNGRGRVLKKVAACDFLCDQGENGMIGLEILAAEMRHGFDLGEHFLVGEGRGNRKNMARGFLVICVNEAHRAEDIAELFVIFHDRNVRFRHAEGADVNERLAAFARKGEALLVRCAAHIEADRRAVDEGAEVAGKASFACNGAEIRILNNDFHTRNLIKVSDQILGSLVGHGIVPPLFNAIITDIIGLFNRFSKNRTALSKKHLLSIFHVSLWIYHFIYTIPLI